MPFFMPMIRDQTGQPFQFAGPPQMQMTPAQMQMMQHQRMLQQQQQETRNSSAPQVYPLSLPVPTIPTKQAPDAKPAKKPRQRSKAKDPKPITTDAGPTKETLSESRNVSPTAPKPKRTRTPTKARAVKPSPSKRKGAAAKPAILTEREKEFKRLYEIELKKKEYLLNELNDFRGVDAKLTYAVQRRRSLNQLIIDHLMKKEREQRFRT